MGVHAKPVKKIRIISYSKATKMDLIEGVTICPLKIIPNPKGEILHAMKASDTVFSGFGEAYFSAVNKGEIKGWKKHLKMTLNLVVPVGNIRFVIFDDREGSQTNGTFFSIILGKKNYQRITVPPNVWMAFQGVSEGFNLLLNIANLEHDPEEAIGKSVEDVEYDWNDVSVNK